MEDDILCVNCKHHVKPEKSPWTDHKCALTVKVDLVTGYRTMEDCHLLRYDDRLCGKRGAWFDRWEIGDYYQSTTKRRGEL